MSDDAARMVKIIFWTLAIGFFCIGLAFGCAGVFQAGSNATHKAARL